MKETIIWRILPGYEDASTYTGEAPPESAKRLTHFWKRYQAVSESFGQQHKDELAVIIRDLEQEKAQLDELYTWFEESPRLDGFFDFEGIDVPPDP